MRNDEEEVLAWVNTVRADGGIGPPLGEMPPDWDGTGPGITSGCPVSVALGVACGTYGVRIGSGRVEFPEYVSRFITNHDRRIAVRDGTTE